MVKAAERNVGNTPEVILADAVYRQRHAVYAIDEPLGARVPLVPTAAPCQVSGSAVSFYRAGS